MSRAVFVLGLTLTWRGYCVQSPSKPSIGLPRSLGSTCTTVATVKNRTRRPAASCFDSSSWRRWNWTPRQAMTEVLKRVNYPTMLQYRCRLDYIKTINYLQGHIRFMTPFVSIISESDYIAMLLKKTNTVL